MNTLREWLKKNSQHHTPTEKEVFGAVVRHFGDYNDVGMTEITYDTNLVDDLFADSLDTVELVMLIEEETGIDIDDTSAENFKTVGDIVKYIDNYKSGTNG